MAIERLSFPHHLNMQAGIEVDMDNLNVHLTRAMKKFGKSAARLREGEYDLTPSIWTRNLYKYNLLVLPSATGVVRMLPTAGDVMSILYGEDEDIVKKGGRAIHLPNDQGIAAVMGPNRFIHKPCLYEVIYYVPGSNPK